MKNLVLLLSLAVSVNIQATVIVGNSGNYTSLVSVLVAGDTLKLDPGVYTNGLNINNLNGTPSAPIVIIGAPSYGSVFNGNACCNTVSIRISSYVSIYNLKLDGLLKNIDAVKGEGTTGNWAHHITLDGLWITGYSFDQQNVGISTKCTAWDWEIRNCTINSAGTGMYLGNSDGTAPFVNGIIENNLIMNTVGYNIEIKHQNDGLRNFTGMTLNGKTILRYNVFSKAQNASSGGYARPNLLVGAFPSIGDGSNDIYEVYGNFFYQNPYEGLFQVTGNSAIYSNIFYNNLGGWGLVIQNQNGFAPRKIIVFHNTVMLDGNNGIDFYGLNSAYASSQKCYANASFSSAVSFNGIPADNAANMSETYTNASNYLNNVTASLPGLNAYPKTGMLKGTLVSSGLFQSYTDWDKDFNGNLYDWTYRGAYSGAGTNLGWILNLEKMPIKQGVPTLIADIKNRINDILLFPNPANEQFIISGNLPPSAKVLIVNSVGAEIFSETTSKNQTSLDVSTLPAGLYFVKVQTNSGTTTKKLQVLH